MSRVNPNNDSFNVLDNSKMKLNKDDRSFSIDQDNESPTLKKSNSNQNTTNNMSTPSSNPFRLIARVWESMSLGSSRQKEQQPKIEEKENASDDENEVDLQKCAKKVLRELREMDKEEIINELLDNNQIQNEEELRALEEDLDDYFAEEYGEDSDEEGRAKFVKKLKKGIKQIKVPGNNDASHEKEPANSSLFVIDIGGDGTKKRKEQESGIFHKGKDIIKPLPKPKQRGNYEVFKNPLLEESSDIDTQVHLCYTREEEINIARYELFSCEYNKSGSTFDILFWKKDPRHVFLADRILYIAKKTIGNFGVIEESVPLARLTKIFANQKGDILRLNYYDDETPHYSQKEISLKITEQSKLLSLIQKNLQGINSSIRIHQTAAVGAEDNQPPLQIKINSSRLQAANQ